MNQDLSQNQNTESLLRELELATSSSPVDLASLDEETAKLRETWLALGEVLRQADTPTRIDTAVSVNHVAVESAGNARPTMAQNSTMGPAVTKWLGYLAAALSLIAIVAFGVWQVRSQTADEVVERPQKLAPQTPPFREPQTIEVEPSLPPAALRELAWDDSLDQSFLSAQVALENFRGLRRNPEESWHRLKGQVDELAREVNFGPL